MANSIRTFYWIMITQTLSMIGSQMTSYGIAVYLFIETGDVTPLGGVAFFAMAARVVATGFSGMWADRYDRRLVMVAADIGQGLTTIILLGAFWTDNLGLVLVFAMSFLSGMFGALQGPALMAATTMLVPDDKRDLANSLQQLSGGISQVTSLILAGVVYGLVGLDGVIVVDLVTFVVAIAVIFSVRIPAPPPSTTPDDDEPLLRRFSLGFRWMYRHRPIFMLAVAAMLVNFFVTMSMLLVTPYLLTITDNDATVTGIVQGIGAAGTIIGALSVPLWSRLGSRMTVVSVALVAEGIFLALLGIVSTPAMFAVAMFVFVFLIPVVNTFVISMMQQKVPADIQGRVFAALIQMAMLIQPIALLMAGPLVDQVFEPAVGGSNWEYVAWLVGDSAGAGMRLLIIINGVLMTVAAGGILMQPQVRQLEQTIPDSLPSASAPAPAA